MQRNIHRIGFQRVYPLPPPLSYVVQYNNVEEMTDGDSSPLSVLGRPMPSSGPGGRATGARALPEIRTCPSSLSSIDAGARAFVIAAAAVAVAWLIPQKRLCVSGSGEHSV